MTTAEWLRTVGTFAAVAVAILAAVIAWRSSR
jgi:hypothetical protein